jgi:polyhydroxyalkanoate synthesis repressor PhaR
VVGCWGNRRSGIGCSCLVDGICRAGGGRLHEGGRHLGHHGDPLRNRFRKRRIVRHRGYLFLPQIEVTARERLEIRRRFRHGESILLGCLLDQRGSGPVCCAAVKNLLPIRANGKSLVASKTHKPKTGSHAKMSEAQNTAAQAPITIKKYANRRLYNTATSSYVTLDHLAQMVKDGADFVVYDAKTGEDITRSVLTQIIVEEEGKGGQNLLPISFLRQIIGFYGDSLGGLVPRYLEYSMSSFSRNEQQMRQYMQNALDGLFPFNPFEEMGKQNMAFFESAMKMFSPFYPHGPDGVPRAPGEAGAEPRLEELQAKISQLQSQLADLSKKK